MNRFVLDNSVSMRWLLTTSKKSDQIYSDDILKSMIDADALVPNLWHLEAANVLLGAEKSGVVTIGEVEGFIAQIENLPINVDPHTYLQSFSRTYALSRAYKISSYDASYLELAIRARLPLATLDKKLLRAAKSSDVTIYLN